MNEKALLLVDSWAGHRNLKTMEHALPSKYMDVMFTPRRTKYLASRHLIFLADWLKIT